MLSKKSPTKNFPSSVSLHWNSDQRKNVVLVVSNAYNDLRVLTGSTLDLEKMLPFHSRVVARFIVGYPSQHSF